MKRYKKKEWLDAIASLTEVNNAIVRSFGSDISIGYDDLTMCQELAVALGNTLEALGNEAVPIIEVLEAYCENIYQVSLVLRDVNQSRKIAKKIQKQLRIIESKIKYSLPDDKKEIAFLPYKASMWDSLESVWKAASEDDSCIAYVVPIPYFDKQKDGTLGQMHYEGDQYPEYVPVTSWKEYNLMERRPDIIYIHNPYDEQNFVTSVHPAFYTAELKKATDMLVYIPYFVAINNKMEEYFCRNPGVFQADRVVVQSEEIREIYLKELHKCEDEYNCKGAFGIIEKKVLALGNPKYDRVTSIWEEDWKIPKEWGKFISRIDGKGKKVVLYNTTIESFLRHNERMLLKIEEVLDKFQKEKDVVLLWRPHPLLLTTLESMRPNLVKKYQNIVERYKKDEIGIYDDSADLYRAIAISDAYFGDMSSVVELYKQTEKPILIQSVFYGGEDALVFEAFVQINDETAYASCAVFNGLFKVDLHSGNCTYMGMFPGEEADGLRLHSKAVYAGGKVFFVPAAAKHISVYQVEQGRLETIPIKECREQYGFYNPNHKFSDAMLYENFLFLISSTYPAVLRMDLDTDKIDYYSDWVPQEPFCFNKGAIRNDTLFYIPNTLNNTVLEFHMDSCRGTLRHIGTDNHGSFSICRSGDDFWLIPGRDGCITRWNPFTNTVIEYNEYPEGFEGRGFLFTKGYVQEDFIKMVPACSNMAVKVSKKNGVMIPDEFAALGETGGIAFLFEEGHYFYLLKDIHTRIRRNPSAWTFFEYIKVNTLDGTLERYHFKFDSGKDKFADDHEEYLHKVRTEQTIEKENLFFNLGQFLNELVTEKGQERFTGSIELSETESTVGKTIHKRILHSLC